jgi:hypothetical protein
MGAGARTGTGLAKKKGKTMTTNEGSALYNECNTSKLTLTIRPAVVPESEPCTRALLTSPRVSA